MLELIVATFVIVYLGMFFGELPRLQLDRTGVALLGAIVLVASGAVGFEEAIDSVDLPTLALLFGLMVVSAQLRLAGFYSHLSSRIASMDVSPPALLACLVGLVAALSAVFSNDIVCLAVPPIVIPACLRRRLNPIPFLLAIACASNAGSAATLIGNPQNMFLGQRLKMSFPGYLALALPIVLVCLIATWFIVFVQYRARWTLRPKAVEEPPAPQAVVPFDSWQATKGLAVSALMLTCFLLAPWPHELVALGGAGIVLLSRRMHSRTTLGLVDWQLLVLFAGLFVVNHAFQVTGIPEQLAAAARLDDGSSVWLFVAAVAGSNIVSNVPAVMLLVPFAGGPLGGEILALASTLAGNLLIVGSIANMIVADAAAAHGIDLDWRTHARTGIPVTIVTLLIAAAGLWMRS